MKYWRVTSWTAENISIALRTGLWGEERAGTLAPFQEGDRLAFYSSGQPKGFVATGSVTGPIFTSHETIWFTATYPFRIPIRLDEGPCGRPISPQAVLQSLGAKRFEHAAPRKGVIPLTRREFEALEAHIKNQDAITPGG